MCNKYINRSSALSLIAFVRLFSEFQWLIADIRHETSTVPFVGAKKYRLAVLFNLNEREIIAHRVGRSKADENPL